MHLKIGISTHLSSVSSKRTLQSISWELGRHRKVQKPALEAKVQPIIQLFRTIKPPAKYSVTCCTIARGKTRSTNRGQLPTCDDHPTRSRIRLSPLWLCRAAGKASVSHLCKTWQRAALIFLTAVRGIYAKTVTFKFFFGGGIGWCFDHWEVDDEGLRRQKTDLLLLQAASMLSLCSGSTLQSAHQIPQISDSFQTWQEHYDFLITRSSERYIFVSTSVSMLHERCSVPESPNSSISSPRPIRRLRMQFPTPTPADSQTRRRGKRTCTLRLRDGLLVTRRHRHDVFLKPESGTLLSGFKKRT